MRKSAALTLLAAILACLMAGFAGAAPKEHAVVIYGDTRTGHEAHEKIDSAILSVSPEAVFNLGDLVADGREKAQWETFNRIARPLMQRVPYYPILGNHEHGSVNYFDNFELPGNERYYSVDLGGVHFVLLDSNSPLAPETPQHVWLGSDLDKAKTAGLRIILLMHHPLLSTGPHGNDEMGVGQYIYPLIKQYGVRAVFAGHDHDYERSERDGVTHVVTGGGGAPLRLQKGRSDYSRVFLRAYHFCVLSIGEDAIRVSVLGGDMKELDSFEIMR